MKSRSLSILAAFFLVFSHAASALTMSQFTEICDSSSATCSDHSLAQAYIGGALDVIAVLNEETDYLGTLYCERPETLFNVSEIIDYMQKHPERHSDRNAMLLVVWYLEKNSGC